MSLAMQKSHPISLEIPMAANISTSSPDAESLMTQSYANSGRLAFKELELLKLSAAQARSALVELQARTIQFRALREHIRVAFKPFRDFLRSVYQQQRSSDSRVLCLLMCERAIQLNFRSLFRQHSNGRTEIHGFSASMMARVLVTNVVTPVIFEAAFQSSKSFTSSRDPQELRATANEYISQLRAHRSRFSQQMKPVLQQLEDHINSNWGLLYETSRQFTTLSEVAGEFEQVISTSKTLSLPESPVI